MNSNAPVIKVFVVYHKPYQLLKTDIITPIHVGRAIPHLPSKDYQHLNKNDDQWMKDNMIGDDTGDNISEKNRSYCELTGIYWAWKNYEKIGNPDYIGFMQYRRHFIFNEDVYNSYIPYNDDERTYSKYTVGSIYEGYSEHFGLSDDNIRKYCNEYDCIIPKKCELKYADISSIKKDYVTSIKGTRKRDYNLLIKIVREIAPEYYQTAKKRMSMSDKNCFQSFILRREHFFDYCAFLFGVLDVVEKKINTANYSINGQRTLGYLGEILFDSYMHKIRENEKVKHKELGMTFICADSISSSIKKKTAIVLLACSDYESLEISLSLYSKYFSDESRLFILQNGRKTFDCERSYRVALEFENLYPKNIKVIDYAVPQKPYFAIREFINSRLLDDYHYICKVDDDSFPITSDWLEKLCECYEYYFDRYGNNLAYVSPLINNNPVGFMNLLENNSELREKFNGEVTGDSESYETIQHYSCIARWLHENTTLKPDAYIEMTSSLSDVELDENKYSMNCMLFSKSYWNDILNFYTLPMSDLDEHLSFLFCKDNNKKVIVRQSIPYIHLFYSQQREKNEDELNKIRELFQFRLNLPFERRKVENEFNFSNGKLAFFRQRVKKSKEVIIRPIINTFMPKRSRRRFIAKRIYYGLKIGKK